ncbi:MAG: hypothetical protein ACFBZ8_04595 [Opitutales bacterium]
MLFSKYVPVHRVFTVLCLTCLAISASFQAQASEAPDGQLVRAIKLLDQMENNLRYLKRGDVPAYNALSAKLNEARTALESTTSANLPQYAAAAQRWNTLQAKLIAIAKDWQSGTGTTGDAASGGTSAGVPAPPPNDTPQAVNQAIQAAFAEAKGLTAENLADPKIATAWAQRIAALQARATPFKDDRLWGRKIQMNLRALEGRVGQAQRALDQQRTAAAQAEGKQLTAKMWDRFDRKKLPPFSLDLEPETARAWGAYRRDLLEKTIAADLAYVEEMYAAGRLSSQDRNSAMSWVGVTGKQRVEEQLRNAYDMMDGKVVDRIRIAEWLKETDLSNPNQVVTRLTGEGAAAEYRTLLQDGLDSVDLAQALDEGSGRQDAPDRAAQRRQLQDGLKAYQAMSQQALSSVVMPKAASTEEKLLQIAAQTLANPDYESARGHERLIINSPFQSKEKWEGNYERGTIRDTITVQPYKWDEFQVATAEQVGEQYFIYYNTLKFFHSGGSTTPTGRWILSARFQGSEILPENIQK